MAKATAGVENRHEDFAAGEVRRHRHHRPGAGDRQDVAGELAELAGQQDRP
jgi:hypothetical protein